MRTNENQSTPGAAGSTPYHNSPIDQYGGDNKPFARCLRLQAVLGVLVVALSRNDHQPLSASQITDMEYLADFAHREAALISEEIEGLASA